MPLIINAKRLGFKINRKLVVTFLYNFRFSAFRATPDYQSLAIVGMLAYSVLIDWNNMNDMKRFNRITKPYLHGFVATRNDGLEVEIVRSYVGEWSVYLTRNDTVVAIPVSHRVPTRFGKALRAAHELI